MTIRRALKVQQVRALLSYDPLTGVFLWLKNRGGTAKVGSVAGSIDSSGYRQIRMYGILYLAHRLAWFYIHGRWPRKGLDHKDLNRDNNILKNLRPCTQSQNSANTRVRSDNVLGIKGVHFDPVKKKFRARMRKHGRLIHLGWFKKVEDAAEAYRKAAHKFYKSFARYRR